MVLTQATQRLMSNFLILMLNEIHEHVKDLVLDRRQSVPEGIRVEIEVPTEQAEREERAIDGGRDGLELRVTRVLLVQLHDLRQHACNTSQYMHNAFL